GGGAAWAMPAAVGAGGLTLAGAGMFTGFSIAARQTFNDLKRQCTASGCPSADPSAVAKADTGKAQQTIAYVSLVVGAVSAVAAGTFAVVALSHPAPVATSRSGQWHLLVGAMTMDLVVEFQ
ncbi:MAG: hypothetical protein M3O36_17790, partial [Myxococcota bacterium]|nr:hypothetical protein [Myxococcota bacterium]